MRTQLVALVLVGGNFGGCSGLAVEPDPGAASVAFENNVAFHPGLRALAAEYESYARVDDELHWAPS